MTETEIRERPILFSVPMVRAILAGTKTQTRRIVKPQPVYAGGAWKCADGSVHQATRPSKSLLASCPYGQPGDRLWVRETWAHDGPDLDTVRSRLEDALSGGISYGPYYRATEVAPATLRWHPSIHMPRWACRLVLEVTDVRVQRLQDISEADAKAEGLSYGGEDSHAPWGVEGVPSTWCDCPVTAYAALWESINGEGSWDANPWCWAITFRRIV